MEMVFGAAQTQSFRLFGVQQRRSRGFVLARQSLELLNIGESGNGSEHPGSNGTPKRSVSALAESSPLAPKTSCGG